MNRIPILSFFAGGGFLDLGFESAGFEILWANEKEEKYSEIYQYGTSSWRNQIQHGFHSAPQINLNSISDLTRSIVLQEAFGSVAPDFFGVIGGPPCQDFTSSGRNKGLQGDRGRFTQSFVDMILQLKPSFFLMENVPGLYQKKHRKTFDSIVTQLEESQPGYLTSAKILSALELGVPQNRDRLFLVGFRKDLIDNAISASYLIGRGSDWFEWPVPTYPGAKNLDWPERNPFQQVEVIRPTCIPLELTVHDLVGDDAESLPNGTDTFVPHSKKFLLIDEGDVSGKSFKRLHRYRYSPTAWYGNNEVHLHPWKSRRLSVREALRIQTVPDTYVMPASSTLTDKFRVISNGVPTLLAHQVAKSICINILEQGLLDSTELPNETMFQT
jgi:DNA (cytosine-5)-methyltransferase 1